MQGVVKILDSSGHTEVPYDTEAPESLEVAQERVRRAMDGGSMLFDTSTKPGERIKDFKPGEHEEVTVVPPFQGG